MLQKLRCAECRRRRLPSMGMQTVARCGVPQVPMLVASMRVQPGFTHPPRGEGVGREESGERFVW